MKPGDKVRLKDGPHLRGMMAKAGATGTVGPLGLHTHIAVSSLLIDIVWDINDLSKGQFDGGYEADKFELIQEEKKAPTKIDYMQITREISGRR